MSDTGSGMELLSGLKWHIHFSVFNDSFIAPSIEERNFSFCQENKTRKKCAISKLVGGDILLAVIWRFVTVKTYFFIPLV